MFFFPAVAWLLIVHYWKKKVFKIWLSACTVFISNWLRLLHLLLLLVGRLSAAAFSLQLDSSKQRPHLSLASLFAPDAKGNEKAKKIFPLLSCTVLNAREEEKTSVYLYVHISVQSLMVNIYFLFSVGPSISQFSHCERDSSQCRNCARSDNQPAK